METIFTRLEEASRMGDVDSLKILLEEDKFLLDRVIARTSARDNPLHIAALLGHADFVADIMSRKPELVKEVNGHGLSPLHLAVARGHLAVSKELLKAGFDLCCVREEKEGLMPLHVAVIKGRTLLVKELLEACEKSIFELTYGGETVLHLAAKSNSLDTLEFLISRVDNLNAKDVKGNTVLHLAVARKQLYVIKLLLTNEEIYVNSVNSKGFTPLDVLLESPQEYGDLVLGEMIRAAGGRTAAEMVLLRPDSISSDCSTSTQHIWSYNSSSGQLRFPKNIEKEHSKPQEKKKRKRYKADIIMVVAILVATITFQAGLNPPGGFIPDDNTHKNDKGHAVLADELSVFLFFDIIGLFSSVSVILLFLCVVPRKRKIVIKFLVWILWLASFSTALAFTLAIQVIYTQIYTYGDDGSSYSYSYISVGVLFIAWFIVLRLGILWASFRLVIFLLEKGKLLESAKEFVCLLMKGRLLRKQQLNGAEETSTNQTKTSSSLRKAIFIVLIACVIIGTIIICCGIYVFFRY